ncbi:MAG: hypothetical protein JNJ89_07625 [Rubrivivax sp.]|nr:hypothetical protein [Rubrivivax sp.]
MTREEKREAGKAALREALAAYNAWRKTFGNAEALSKAAADRKAALRLGLALGEVGAALEPFIGGPDRSMGPVAALLGAAALRGCVMSVREHEMTISDLRDCMLRLGHVVAAVEQLEHEAARGYSQDQVRWVMVAADFWLAKTGEPPKPAGIFCDLLDEIHNETAGEGPPAVAQSAIRTGLKVWSSLRPGGC